MSGKEKIIESILNDARAQSAEILARADESAAAILLKAQRECEEAKQAAEKLAEENAKATLSRRIAVARLDARKETLAAKQQALTKVFDLACEKLCSPENANYKQFILRLLDRYAEDGECVVLCERDKARVTPQDIYMFAAERQMRLSCRYEGDFAGGVLLERGTTTKNVTVPTLLKELKESDERRIYGVLFGGENE